MEPLNNNSVGQDVKLMDQVIPDDIRKKFRRYMKREFPARHEWCIASDYCIGNADYPNDVLVFAVFPEPADHQAFASAIKNVLPADLKKRSIVDDRTIASLNSKGIFWFAFAIDKDPRLLRRVEHVRTVINEMLDFALEAGPHRDLPTNIAWISKLKYMKHKSQSRSFAVSKFNRVYMAAVFASYITLLLARNCRLKRIFWIGDRDEIHSSWDMLYFPLFHHLSFRYMHDERLPLATVRVPSKEADFEAEFDAYTRLPDYLAGPLAHMDLRTRLISAKSVKYSRIIKEVITDNEQFHFASISFNSSPFLKIIKITNPNSPKSALYGKNTFINIFPL